MQERGELRVEGVVDHIAVKSEDLRADVREYERLGFRVETVYDDWAMMRDARGFGVALLPPDSKQRGARDAPSKSIATVQSPSTRRASAVAPSRSFIIRRNTKAVISDE